MASEWQACELLRVDSSVRCTVRLAATGAVLGLNLREPLDLGLGILVSPLAPVEARVLLRSFDGKEHSDCELEVCWRRKIYPPPKQFLRKRRTHAP